MLVFGLANQDEILSQHVRDGRRDESRAIPADCDCIEFIGLRGQKVEQIVYDMLAGRRMKQFAFMTAGGQLVHVFSLAWWLELKGARDIVPARPLVVKANDSGNRI